MAADRPLPRHSSTLLLASQLFGRGYHCCSGDIKMSPFYPEGESEGFSGF